MAPSGRGESAEGGSNRENPAATASPATGSLRLLSKNLRYLDLIPRESVLEKIVHLVLEGHGPFCTAAPVFGRILDEFRRYPTESVRVVVFGGGTGLSSILGGEANLGRWGLSPFGGLKRYFQNLTVVVCVTDDGGSSGRLLREIPCIAPGDLRRAILASILPRNLLLRFPSLYPQQLEVLARSIGKILEHRFGPCSDRSVLQDPVRLLEDEERTVLPEELARYLSGLGEAVGKIPALRNLSLEGQCLGNLLLVASIYGQPGSSKAFRGDTLRSPSPAQIVRGIQSFAEALGSGRRTIFPASTVQGELQVLYQHGVLSSGEDKAARRHSSFPVNRVWVHFVEPPKPDKSLLDRIAQADLILIAPGSLYTSIIPIFQVPGIADAVRKNHKALKILGANFWVQRGETDISLRRKDREYYVSELIEAYHNNIPGGAAGLFGPVIVTDLQSVPADILRNYALEGKTPIYLDKDRVKRMGFLPVEAAVFSEERLRSHKVIQHDPEKFAQAVKTLYFLRGLVAKETGRCRLGRMRAMPPPIFPRKGTLCAYWRAVRERVASMDISDSALREIFLETIWNNREILPEHLSFAAGIRKIAKSSWERSTEWDKILGYYDPEDGYIKVREDLLDAGERRVTEDIFIALGESLLGNYAARKSVRELRWDGRLLGKIFEVELRPLEQRRTFLSDPELREYLRLAQLEPGRGDPMRFRMLVNGNDAFTPPGLLFGLLYAWYLDNRYGGVVDYEMSLLRWKVTELIPKPSMERSRLQSRVDFFRRVVFRQKIPAAAAGKPGVG